MCVYAVEVELNFSQSWTHYSVYNVVWGTNKLVPYLQHKLFKTHTNFPATTQVNRKSTLWLFQDSKLTSPSLKQFLKRGVVLAIFTMITLALRLAVTNGGPTQKVINRYDSHLPCSAYCGYSQQQGESTGMDFNGKEGKRVRVLHHILISFFASWRCTHVICKAFQLWGGATSTKHEARGTGSVLTCSRPDSQT